MAKLYTGYGDSGHTQTLNNKHISKSDSVIELLGTIDEFTSFLGAAKAYSADRELISDIELIQKKLISVMGEISGGKRSVTEECITYAEQMCDKYFDENITEFALPGKNIVSAQLDIARCVIRRAERVAVKVSQTGRISKLLLIYINRLSDAVYAMARYAEKESAPALRETGECGNTLTLELAKELAYAVEKRAEQLGKKIVVAIVDAGANLIFLQSMDDAYIASCKIAQDKAYTSAALKMPTHTAFAESKGGKLDGLAATDRISLLGGGYPLIADGKIIGAIGVSGGTCEEDTEFAHFGALYIERRLKYNG